MTPIYKYPVHTTYDGIQQSRVFHKDHPRRIVAIFQGPDHVADSEEFCRLMNPMDPAEPGEVEDVDEEEEDPPVEYAQFPYGECPRQKGEPDEYSSDDAVNWWCAASNAEREAFLLAVGGTDLTAYGAPSYWRVCSG